MFTHTIMLAMTLTVTPPLTTLPAGGHVETVSDRGSLIVYVYDEDDTQVGSLGLFVESDGTLLSIVDYDDGWAQVMALPDGSIVFDPDSSLTPDQVTDRAEALARSLTYQPQPEKGWIPCALGVVTTTAALASANPWALVLAINAACACIPHLSQEFQDLKCPGY